MKVWTDAMVDKLCRYVEEDTHSFRTIARMMGLTEDQVMSQWRRIRVHYEQALEKRNRRNGF